MPAGVISGQCNDPGSPLGQLVRRWSVRGLGLLLAIVLPCSPALRGADTAFPAPLAAQALLLDIARAGDRLVAVGEHGNVVISADEGRTWRQVIVPTRALLTGVSFPDATHGWIVGHDGVILATADAGATWRRQDAGNDLETVFLDVLFLDRHRGFAVGAYGKFLVTTDGGQTWQAQKPAEADLHYNRITAGPGGRLILAGEAGTVLLSDDNGQSWQARELPYDGSLFGVLPLADGSLVAFGLRGHILSSTDQGATWTEHENEITAIIMGGIQLADGRVLLAGQGGNFFLRAARGGGFVHWQPAELGSGVADLIPTTDGAIVAVGEAGAVRLELP